MHSIFTILSFLKRYFLRIHKVKNDLALRISNNYFELEEQHETNKKKKRHEKFSTEQRIPILCYNILNLKMKTITSSFKKTKRTHLT